MRMNEMKENEVKKILRFKSKNNAFLRRIEAMGLKKGEKVKVERKIGRNLVISTEGRKMAIDEELAKQIEVD